MDGERYSRNTFAVNMFKVDENEEETTYSEDEREYDRGGGYSDESSNMPTTTTSNSNTMSSSDNNQGTPRPKFNINDMVFITNAERIAVKVIDRYLDETRDGNIIWKYRVKFDDGDTLIFRESYLMEVPANSGSSSSTTTTTTTTTTTSGGDGSSSRGSSRSSKKRRLKDEDEEKKEVRESLSLIHI